MEALRFIKPTDVTGKKKNRCSQRQSVFRPKTEETKPKGWKNLCCVCVTQLDNWQSKSLLDVK